jgi:hypothetical protein
LANLNLDGRITLVEMLKKQGGRVWTGHSNVATYCKLS